MTYSYKTYNSYDFDTIDTPGKCWVCEVDTHTIEINFETYLCRWCSSIAWFNYFRSLDYQAKPHDAIYFQNSPNHAIML